MKCQQHNINPRDPKNEDKIAQLAKDSSIRFPQLGKVELDNQDVSDLIRTSDITKNISPVASNTQVREILADQQRAMAKGDIPGVEATGFQHNNKTIKGVIMDGRDIGTVILPDAELKVFIVADVRVRAERRFEELKKRQGDKLKDTLQDVQDDLEARDLADRTRKVSPLLKADDAVELDTTHLTIEEQVNSIKDMVYNRI